MLQKSNASVFSNFQGPGYMKIHKNQMLQFSRIFITPGYTKFHKNQMHQFSRIFMTRVHEISQKSDASILSNINDPRYTKFHKNQMLQFSQIFMAPGTRNFTKIKHFNFLKFSWPPVHEISQKSNTLVFSNFHDPGYIEFHKNQTFQFSQIFMTPGSWNFTKIKHFSFLEFSWPRVHRISQK